MAKKEFIKLEKWIFDVYKESLSTDLMTDLKSSKELFKIFPFFHQNVAARLENVQNNSFSNITNIQIITIENFPKREYFKIGIICKLCLLFLLFAGNLKGLNFPIFISFLVFYYWYNNYYIRHIVKVEIDQFYQKKIEELNIKTSDLEKYGMIEHAISQEDQEEEIKINVEKIIERANKPQEHKNIIKSEIINSRIFENEKILNKNEDVEMSQKNEPKEIEINQIKNNEIKENNKENCSLENEIIHTVDNSIKIEAQILNKKEEIINKIENLKQDEPLFVKITILVFGIVVSFFLSLYPNWCDNFEENNPIIERANQNKIIRQEEINKDNIQLNSVNSNKNDEENDILIENIDQKLNQNRLYNSSVVSPSDVKDRNEKNFIKSSTNTKKVNIDDEQTKYLFAEENEENRTENEFVFSENINIDNLSYYNEPTESSKKKENDITIKPLSAFSNNGKNNN